MFRSDDDDRRKTTAVHVNVTADTLVSAYFASKLKNKQE
jgi:hypothetical protein